MATAVIIFKNLLREARKYSKIDHRSLTGQIEHWASIGKCAEENPDLTYGLIKEIFLGIHELDQGEKLNIPLVTNFSGAPYLHTIRLDHIYQMISCCLTS